MPYGTIAAETIQSGTAGQPPQFKDSNGVEQGELCRAWVNFNGSGTVAIRTSFNVSSITDNGVGDYTVNFTNAIQDVNYSVVATATNSQAAYGAYVVGNEALRARTTTTWSLLTLSYNATQDTAYVNVAVFR